MPQITIKPLQNKGFIVIWGLFLLTKWVFYDIIQLNPNLPRMQVGKI